MDSEYDGSLELIRSLGVGVLSNEEYADKTSREARKAETDLESLKQRSFRQISNCWTQFSIAQEEARQEHEKKMMAEMVAKELDMFRGEMEKKEKDEDARIRNLYSALMGGGTPASSQVDTQFDVHGNKFVSIDGSPLIIESPPVRFPAAPRTYEAPSHDAASTWEKNIDFMEGRRLWDDTIPSSSPSTWGNDWERLRSVIPAPNIGFEKNGGGEEETYGHSKKAPAKDGVGRSDLKMPELNPANNARGMSVTFSNVNLVGSHRQGAHSPSSKRSILKPSAIQNAEALNTVLNAGCVAKDAEFDEVERILRLNEQKLAKLTALHF